MTGNRHFAAHFDIHTYNIVATAQPSNGGTIQGAGTYDHGSQVTLTAVPASAFDFAEWTENGESIPGAGASYSFEAISDRSLVALFTPKTYVLTFNVRRAGNNQPILDAQITLNGEQHPAGQYVFEGLLPATYAYVVSREGYFNATGNVTISNSNVTRTVNMTVDDTSADMPEAGQIMVYPVPAGDYLHIRTEGRMQSLQLLDLSGRMVKELEPMTDSYRISLEGLLSGVYLLRVQTDEGVLVKRIQKQ